MLRFESSASLISADLQTQSFERSLSDSLVVLPNPCAARCKAGEKLTEVFASCTAKSRPAEMLGRSQKHSKSPCRVSGGRNFFGDGLEDGLGKRSNWIAKGVLAGRPCRPSRLSPLLAPQVAEARVRRTQDLPRAHCAVAPPWLYSRSPVPGYLELQREQSMPAGIPAAKTREMQASATGQSRHVRYASC